jgi:hypothetical protein
MCTTDYWRGKEQMPDTTKFQRLPRDPVVLFTQAPLSEPKRCVCVYTCVHVCVCVCVCVRARVRVGVDAAKTLDVSVWCAHLRGAKYMNLREGLCAHQSVAHRSHSQLLPCTCTSNTQELPIVSNSARNDSSPVHRYEPDSSTQAPVSWR